MSIETIIKNWNNERKNNKNQWVFFGAILNGESVRIKSYNTFIQRIEYKNICDGGPCDCTVKVATATIENILNEG